VIFSDELLKTWADGRFCDGPMMRVIEELSRELLFVREWVRELKEREHAINQRPESN
jgi:hypothetical protein